VNIHITVIQNTLKTAMSKANKPYKLHEIVYKNHSYQDKVEEVKINEFSKLFKTIGNLQAGQGFEVVKEKNDGGFWEWQSVTPLVPGAVPAPLAPTKSVAAAVAKSTYETPEERAKKQVYIVKQSSIGYAIEMLSVGAKTALKKEDVLVLAQELSNWVFSTDPGMAFDDIPDDLPGEVEVV
jgi:hypothetical protein